MSLLDMFDKEKRRQSAIARSTKKLLQIYGQTESRGAAIQRLREDGSDEAIYALLMRFTVRVEPGITDDEEKSWVLEILREFGNKALGPIRKFVFERDAVTWPLRAVVEIKGPQAAVELACEVLRKMSTEYQRASNKQVMLIKQLMDLGLQNDDVTDTLILFLEDMDGDIVVAAVEALGQLDAEGKSREPLLACFKEKGEGSVRLRRVILEVFAERGWNVKGYRPTVEEMLEAPYHLTGDGVVKKTGG